MAECWNLSGAVQGPESVCRPDSVLLQYLFLSEATPFFCANLYLEMIIVAYFNVLSIIAERALHILTYGNTLKYTLNKQLKKSSVWHQLYYEIFLANSLAD